MSRPRAPKTLGDAGRALWKAIQGDLDDEWELDARDLANLERACHVADRIDELDTEVRRDGVMIRGSRGQKVLHPAVAEIRQLELARLRLLSVLELVDPKSGTRTATPAQARARDAANVRWDLERRRRGTAA